MALSVTVPEAPCAGNLVAGVDLGLRYLAVVNCGGETLFFKGNKAAYVRRRLSALRRRMSKAKALNAIRKMGDKEARWARDQDHKISNAIVRWCKSRGVGTIRMERLNGVRNRRCWVRQDNGRSLRSWSFYRLQQFIAYKARLAGIRVEWVESKNTSRTCPQCGHCDEKNRNGIWFECRNCGYHGHADVVAALNISRAISGLAGADSCRLRTAARCGNQRGNAAGVGRWPGPYGTTDDAKAETHEAEVGLTSLGFRSQESLCGKEANEGRFGGSVAPTDVLAEVQGVKPVESLQDLAADIWDSKDELEAFLADVYASRKYDYQT